MATRKCSILEYSTTKRNKMNRRIGRHFFYSLKEHKVKKQYTNNPRILCFSNKHDQQKERMWRKQKPKKVKSWPNSPPLNRICMYKQQSPKSNPEQWKHPSGTTKMAKSWPHSDPFPTQLFLKINKIQHTWLVLHRTNITEYIVLINTQDVKGKKKTRCNEAELRAKYRPPLHYPHGINHITRTTRSRTR